MKPHHIGKDKLAKSLQDKQIIADRNGGKHAGGRQRKKGKR